MNMNKYPSENMKTLRINTCRIIAIFILSALLLAGTLYAQNEKETIDEYMDILTAKNEFIGSILAAKDGEIVISKGCYVG